MNILFVVEATLSQIKDLLKAIDELSYQKPLAVFSNSSIGQHTRHIIEFLQCLIQQQETGVISYDKRVRDQLIETDRQAAITSIEEIFAKLPRANLKKKLLLVSNYGDSEDLIHTTSTTFERELIYNIEHAIHHMAIIKIGLKELTPKISLPKGFGVASSTIRHRRMEARNT